MSRLRVVGDVQVRPGIGPSFRYSGGDRGGPPHVFIHHTHIIGVVVALAAVLIDPFYRPDIGDVVPRSISFNQGIFRLSELGEQEVSVGEDILDIQI